MNNLITTFYNNIDSNEVLYLYFNLGENKYGINIKNVVEVMKLPQLEYPQKLPNNVVGLLRYNNFTIKVLDLRFYLNIKISKYNISNKLLIVKTDETLFAIIIDKIDDIIALDMSQTEKLSLTNDNKIIEFIYHGEKDTISSIDLSALERLLKTGTASSDVDIPSLFPSDDFSKNELSQRKMLLQEKSSQNILSQNAYSQDKFISFSLGECYYCLDLGYIKEFLKVSKITPIPCNFNYVEGVIVLRGDFVTIINTKIFLGLSQQKESEEEILDEKKNIIIVEISDYKIGFLVDEIYNIMKISEDQIKTNLQDKFISSEVLIDEKVYSILNIKNILSDEKFFIEEES